MERTVISAEEIHYSGSFLGFEYNIIKQNDADFSLWLETKLERYIFSEIEKEIIKKLLGLDKLEERIIALEAK